MDFKVGDEVVDVNLGWVGTVKALLFTGALRIDFRKVGQRYRHPQDIKLTKKSIINRFFNEDKMQD